MSTDAQLRANRANSQLSQGPVSDLGKSISSRNALKHGLTGATVVLPTDKIEDYDKLVAMIFKKFNPETDPERHVIQTIADTEWRLLRFPFLESAAYAKGNLDAERPIWAPKTPTSIAKPKRSWLIHLSDMPATRQLGLVNPAPSLMI